MKNFFIFIFLASAATLTAQDNNVKPVRFKGNIALDAGISGIAHSDVPKAAFFASRSFSATYFRDLADKQYWSLATGLGISSENYASPSGFYFNADSDTKSEWLLLNGIGCEHNISRSKFRVTYLDLPLEARFRPFRNLNIPYFLSQTKFSLGAKAGLRLGSMVKIRQSLNGNRMRSFKEQSSLNLLPYRAGVYARFTVDKYSLFAYRSLTPLFSSADNPFGASAVAWQIGLTLTTF